MKHTFKITLILLAMFLFSQLIGLAVVNKYVDFVQSSPSGDITAETFAPSEAENISWSQLPFDIDRPQVEEGWSFIYLAIAVAIGTLLALLLVRYKSVMLWKFWFFISVWLTMGIAFAAFVAPVYAAIVALVFALLKVFRRDVLIYNLTELFIYAGIAAIIVPIVNLFSAFLLLLAISVYDIYAVWKSKHMVTMAKFQTNAGLFAGFMFPYGRDYGVDKGKVKEVGSKVKEMVSKAKDSGNSGKRNSKGNKDRIAILGGGDIAFPLIFSGVVLKSIGLLWASVIPFFVTASLAFLFWRADKNRFYPAMPFLSIGCVIGFLAVILARLIF